MEIVDGGSVLLWRGHPGADDFPVCGAAFPLKKSGQKRKAKKTPLESGVFLLTVARSRLAGRCDVGGLQTLRAVFHFKAHCLTFCQGFESAGLDCREMYEYIRTTIRRSDESKTFGIVKPLYGTCRHFNYLIKKIKH